MNLSLTTATRIGLYFVIGLAIAAMLYLGATILIPVTIAILLASVLFPAAKFFHDRLYLPWFFSSLITISAVIAMLLFIFGAFAIAIPRTIEGFPKTEEEWKVQYKKIQRNLSQVVPYKVEEWLPYNPDDSNVFKRVKEFFNGPKMEDAIVALIKAAGIYLWQTTLIMFITLFLLIEGQMLADKMRAIFGPSGETQRRVSVALAEMAEAIRTYLVWRTIVNLGLGIVLGAVYKYLGLQYWYLWALLVVVFSYVPYLGTIAAGIPPILDALIFVDPFTALIILGFYTCVVTFEGYIIIPWVMGRSMDLNATTVLLACLFWDLVWGMAGLFLAMPIMAAVKAICMQVEGWQRWGDLMGSGPPKPIELETDPEKMRLEEIALRSHSGDGTVVMDHGPGAEQGGSPDPGAPKSDPYR
jgi:predicted PurR-regulated permease PerM